MPSPDPQPFLASKLTDPGTCGEDLAFNLANVSSLAAQYCPDCADYHVLFAARRIARSAESVEIDRAEIAALVTDFVSARLHKGATTRIVIAGASDTGILATAAHGVAAFGEAALARVSFTVLDRCRTPLELCLAFARHHGLTVETDVVDLTTDAARREADLVVVHSLFRQLPPASHVAALRRFAAWLRPGGRIVFSHRIEGGEDAAANVVEREATEARIRHGLNSGELTLGESLATFGARLARRKIATGKHVAIYRSVESLLGLFAAADLDVLSTKTFGRGPVVAGGPPRSRLLAVVSPR